MCNLLGIAKLLFEEAVPATFLPTMCKASNFSTSTAIRVIASLFHFNLLPEFETVPHCAFDSPFLND